MSIPEPRLPGGASDFCFINAFPVELLGSIFKFGLELETYDINPFASIDDDSSPVISDLKPFAVLVTHVCRFWREAAINLPTLWNVIVVNIEEPNLKSALRARNLAEIYFERAGNAPLDIDITFPHTHNNKMMNRIHSYGSEIMEMAYRRHAQWRSFEVTIRDWPFMCVVLKYMETIQEVPLLESLSLQNQNIIGRPFRFQPQQFASFRTLPFHSNAPKLRKLILQCAHLDWESASESSLFRNLEELELSDITHNVRPTYSQYTHILSHSPSLTTFILRGSGPAGDHGDWIKNVKQDAGLVGMSISQSLPRVRLPAVKSLTLDYIRDEVYMQSLMEYHDFPNLAELTLRLAHQNDSAYFRELAIPRSNGKSILQQLTTLRLLDCYCNPSLIYSSLQQLQNVTHLELNFRHLHYQWMYFLLGEFDRDPSCVIRNPKIPCPRLETLTIRGLLGPDVLAMVEERRAAGFPLKRLSVEKNDNLDPKDEKKIRELVKLERYESWDEDDADDVDFGGIISYPGLFQHVMGGG